MMIHDILMIFLAPLAALFMSVEYQQKSRRALCNRTSVSNIHYCNMTNNKGSILCKSAVSVTKTGPIFSQ